MIRLILTLFFLNTFLWSNIYYIENESKFLNIINLFEKNKDLHEEHTFIFDKLNIKSELYNKEVYKNIKLNILDKKGSLIQITDLHQFVSELNTVFVTKKDELVIKNNDKNNIKTTKNEKIIENIKSNEQQKTEVKVTVEDKKTEQKETKKTKVKKEETSQEELASIVNKIIEENKNYITEVKLEEKTEQKETKKSDIKPAKNLVEIKKDEDVIKENIAKLKEEKTLTVKNPFKNEPTELYKFMNINYSKNELLEKIKKSDITINDETMSELFLVLRTFKEDLNVFNLLKKYYQDNVSSVVNYETQIYALNTLLTMRKEIDLEKSLGKILLRNQRNIKPDELKLSYKLLGIYQ